MPSSTPGQPVRVAFVIGGVQKGGTTALAAMLARHPALALPAMKEAHLFDVDHHFENGSPPYARYHTLWGERFGAAVCGDATPAYCWWPPAAERIRSYNPAMRWILLLRDPVSRAYSHWNMNRLRGRVRGTFENAVDSEIAHMQARPGAMVRGPDRVDHSYLARGLYAQQLERIWSLFPREQTLVLDSEALRGDPTLAVDRICAFLGVGTMGPQAPIERHVGRYEGAMDSATRTRLVEFFEPETRRLEALLGWRLPDWRR